MAKAENSMTAAAHLDMATLVTALGLVAAYIRQMHARRKGQMHCKVLMKQ